MKLNSDILAFSVLAAAESAHSFSSYLPSYYTIKHFVLCADDGVQVDREIADLRSGYKPALIFGLGLSAVISVLAKSPLPFVLALGSSALMINQYEQALPIDKRLKNPLDIFTALLPPPENGNGNGNGATLSTSQAMTATSTVASLGI